MFIIIYVFAVTGIQLFAANGETPYFDGETLADSNFNDLASAMTTLFVLVTTENYPSVRLPCAHTGV